MGFKEDLDRYLTTPPKNYHDDWCEEVYNHLDEDKYDQMEDDGFLFSDSENNVLWRLHIMDVPVDRSAEILWRYFKLFGKTKK